MGQIVVGVDGSADAEAALRWAIEEARRHGDSVRAVYVYGLSSEHNPFLTAYASLPTATGAKRTAEDAQRWREERAEATRLQAEGELSSIVGGVMDEQSDVKVATVAVGGGRPAQALLEQASDCALLVVGARGRGGFRGLRLGSIAEKCVRHAPCSVMVVRAKRGGAPARRADDGAE
jgi:nucleotide-binding universal stress UspA family protein